ncbi:WcaI family glycosyltransferase [bacterium]|jgi:colanic acid biosynthesis glycosyl transferase WcaI|nr:WcaI family glycosyltransferase [bacterium]
MRVTVVGINYHPETTGIGPFNTGLCEYLAKDHEVEMISTFSYYPLWKKNPEDEKLLFRTDDIKTVTVHRGWHYVPVIATAIKRMVHELTFIGSSVLRALFSQRPDVYVVVAPPLLSGLAIGFIAKLKGRPVIFHIQDLQPDAAVWLGMLTQRWLIKTLYWFEALTYQWMDVVSGITPAMVSVLLDKNLPRQKVKLLPNWIPISQDAERPARNTDTAMSVRRDLGLADDTFLAVYSGNLGSKQGLDVLLDAALELKKRNVPASKITLMICGDGAEKVRLTEKANELGLENLVFKPLLPYADYQAILTSIDVSLVTQVLGSGKAFFPSKVLSILAAGCPILAVCDDESPLHESLAEANAGVSAHPEEPANMVDQLLRLANEPEILETYSKSGFTWVKRFSPETVLANFDSVLQAMSEKQTRLL